MPTLRRPLRWLRAMLLASGLAALAGTVAGCGSMYRPALYDTNLPAAVPLHGDAGGTYYGLEGGSAPAFNDGERLWMGRGHYMIAEHRGPVRVGYGAYFYGGNYRIQDRLNAMLQGPRSFGGAGAQADLAFVGSLEDNISVGAGVYAALGLELGPYPLLWKRHGMLPYLALADLYTTFGARLGGDRWFALQCGYGLPGLLSVNAQLDLGEVLLWGGAGTSLRDFPSPGPMSRFTAGVTFRER